MRRILLCVLSAVYASLTLSGALAAAEMGATVSDCPGTVATEVDSRGYPASRRTRSEPGWVTQRRKEMADRWAARERRIRLQEARHLGMAPSFAAQIPGPPARVAISELPEAPSEPATAPKPSGQTRGGASTVHRSTAPIPYGGYYAPMAPPPPAPWLYVASAQNRGGATPQAGLTDGDPGAAVAPTGFIAPVYAFPRYQAVPPVQLESNPAESAATTLATETSVDEAPDRGDTASVVEGEQVAVLSTDADGDGVGDAQDLCAKTPAGEGVDAFGCETDTPIILNGVNFLTDSVQLTEESKVVLNGIADTLVEHPELKIEISGHTDADGDAAYNKGLSQRRADRVMAYLATKGVGIRNMVAIGYGEERPVASNDTLDGKALNRRVELDRVYSE